MNSRHNNLRIVIIAPKGLRTGGPEAMHQLHHAIRQQGKHSLLVPWPRTGNRNVVQQYSKYYPTWGKIWHTRKSDIVIIPESLGQLPFFYFLFISRQNLFLWMLSVDFSFEKKFQKYEARHFKIHPAWQINKHRRKWIENISIQKLTIKFLSLVKLKSNKFRDRYLKYKINIDLDNYLFQSVYAREIFKTVNDSGSGIMLSDYTNIENIQKVETSDFCTCTKKHVAYFPGKSFNLIPSILEINSNKKELIHFIAIQSLEHGQVMKLLSKSDLFLDLGYFPGKDRLPREAIILNCPVLLARRGAARFKEDFPLPNIYLLDLEKLDPEATFGKIQEVLSKEKKYNLRAQKEFKNAVRKEKTVFTNEVRKLLQICSHD